MNARRSSGLTLTEIMVAAALVTAILAIAIPSMGRYFEDMRVKSAARSVADALMLARGESIRTGSRFFVAFQFSLGATSPIEIVDDGPAATANCTIDANETRHSVPPVNGVVWGTTSTLANGAPAPDDAGLAPLEVPTGSSFTDASRNPNNGATWVAFQPDGLPRLFTPNAGSCAAVGIPGQGGGAIYLTNTRRDYAVVLSHLGTVRVHVWEPHNAAWSQ